MSIYNELLAITADLSLAELGGLFVEKLDREKSGWTTCAIKRDKDGTPIIRVTTDVDAITPREKEDRAAAAEKNAAQTSLLDGAGTIPAPLTVPALDSEWAGGELLERVRITANASGLIDYVRPDGTIVSAIPADEFMARFTPFTHPGEVEAAAFFEEPPEETEDERVEVAAMINGVG